MADQRRLLLPARRQRLWPAAATTLRAWRSLADCLVGPALVTALFVTAVLPSQGCVVDEPLSLEQSAYQLPGGDDWPPAATVTPKPSPDEDPAQLALAASESSAPVAKREPANPQPEADEPDVCRQTEACAFMGKCTWSTELLVCVVATDGDCQASSWCHLLGRCTRVKGECRAATDEDCKQSEACEWSGACKASAGKCVQ